MLSLQTVFTLLILFTMQSYKYYSSRSWCVEYQKKSYHVTFLNIGLYKNTKSFSSFPQKRENLLWWNIHRLVSWYISWKLILMVKMNVHYLVTNYFPLKADTLSVNPYLIRIMIIYFIEDNLFPLISKFISNSHNNDCNGVWFHYDIKEYWLDLLSPLLFCKGSVTISLFHLRSFDSH